MATYTTPDAALAAKYPFAALPTEDGRGWEIVFPDIPGVVGFATTWDAVGTEAETILQIHIEGMIEDGHPIPAPDVEWNPVTRGPDDYRLPETYSSSEVAEMLGITGRRVAALSRSRNLGRMVGGTRVYTLADVEAMRDRRPGRPRKVA